MRILHAPTRTAVAAVITANGTQSEMLEAVADAWAGGNIQARIYGAGGQHLRTLTLGPWTFDELTPRGMSPGAVIADTAIAPNTPGAAGISPVLVEYRLIDGTLIADTDDVTLGPIRTLCRPTLSGVRHTALSTLPLPTFDPGGNVLLTLAGQSNADGRGKIADLSAAPLSSDPGLATLGASSFSRVFIWRAGSWQQLLLGTNNGGVNPAPGSGTEFGPEFGLAVRWMRETTAGNLYIVKNGASGASITGFEPDAGFNQYQILESAHTAAQAALASASIAIVQKCFVWVQGETDNGQTQSWYQTRMEAVLAAAYLDNWFEATDKQILFQMGTTSTLYGAGVAAAKAAIAATDPTNIKAPASPNYWDSSGFHQNARGQVQMGYDAFALIFGRSTITV